MRKIKLFGKKKNDNIVQDIEYVEVNTAEIQDDEEGVLEELESAEGEDVIENTEIEEDEAIEETEVAEKTEEVEIEETEEIEIEVAEEAEEVETEVTEEAEEAETEVAEEAEDKSEENSTEIIEHKFEVIDLDSDETETEETEEKKVNWKKILKITGIVIGVLVAIYLLICAFFSQFFYYGTTIDGTDYSWKRVKDVESVQEDWVNSYKLDLYTVDGKAETIVGGSIDMEYIDGTQVDDILHAQNPFLWPQMFFNTYEYTTTIQVEYDKDELNKVVDQLACMNESTWTEPQNATIEYKDGAYVIVPHEAGTTIERTKFIEVLDKTLLAHAAEMNILEEGCYALPEHTAESQLVQDTVTELNRLLKGTIQYTEGESVDTDMIASWIVVNELYEISLDTESINIYVQTLADEYNTVGTTRYFTSPDGKAVEVTGGAYGWRVDQEAEATAITENIQAGEPVEREIAYSKSASIHAANDWGNTYAEVDLSAQKMWFIQDGNVVLESPIVTGLSGVSPTPQGIYHLSYKTSPAVLRGPIQPDGTREYESPVSYWMPFNGGIGFHDATWQSSFGGNAYTYRGSHGCVNMPLGKAGDLYSYIYAGCPVVCHY